MLARFLLTKAVAQSYFINYQYDIGFSVLVLNCEMVLFFHNPEYRNYWSGLHFCKAPAPLYVPGARLRVRLPIDNYKY